MAIVYKHIRKDTNQVFYIGIGKTKKRAFSDLQRNRHWKGVVKKHGYEVEILHEGLTWEDACKKEIELISKYGRSDLGLGSLVNQTDGGDGNNNQYYSAETRRKMALAHKGMKRSEETRKKISESHKGKKLSKEHIEKMRLSMTGKTHSDETKRKLSELSKGREVSESVRENTSITNSQFKYEKYTKDNRYIETFDSMYLALQSINKPSTYRGIYHAIQRDGSCGGFKWKKIEK